MSKKAIQTSNAPAAVGPYSQAVEINGMLYISGQLAANFIGTEDVEGEAHQVMKNIGAILTEAGLNYNHVVKATLMLKEMEDFTIINQVYASYFSEPFPARETYQVARLYKDLKLEISVIAIKS